MLRAKVLKLTSLLKVYPKNRLLKHLISSAWGYMNANNKFYKRWDEIQSEKLNIRNNDSYDYNILEYFDNGTKEYSTLLNTKSPYKFNIRSKPWVTAIRRNMTAEIALQNTDNVVRIQTDCSY